MIRTTRISFNGSAGTPLDARFDHPIGPLRATAIFAHCFTCSKDLAAASRVSRALAGRGIGVLRFDFTGLGHSEGEFANTSFSSNIEDLVLAADHLRAENQAPALLIGHSLGGAAVLAAASRIPEATAVVTIGAPSSPQHIKRLLAAGLDDIAATGTADVELAGRRFTIRREMIEDLDRHPLGDRIKALRKALLVMHSPQDDTVGIENASEIFLAAHHPKSFVSLDGADHLLTKRPDAEYAADVIAGWASRYLPAPPSEPEQKPEPGDVRVSETGYGTFANDVQVGPHRLRADEPRSVGGDDTGPSPYGLLAAALGTCTTMALRMYANRKKIPLEHVAVTVRHEKVHAQDCESCETKKAKIDRFDRVLEFSGPLDAAQHERLVEIADLCPVHRSLEGEIEIRTWTADTA